MKTFNFKVYTAISMAATIMLATSCMKEFLDIKRDKSQVIPVTLEDYRSIFEHHQMNYEQTVLGEVSGDDYFVSAQRWNGLADPVQKNAYVWADNIFQEETSGDWNRAYERILYANFVFEGVGDIDETTANKALRDEVLGAAHFFRAVNLYQLAQVFCKQYDPSTASGDLGLPLRTTSNVNVEYQRASLEATYGQILSDLENAERLLPSQIFYSLRPNRVAALAMLANVHLQMGDYQSAYTYADAAFRIAPEILDYNDIDVSSNTPFAQHTWNNQEIIFYSEMRFAAVLMAANLEVDSTLYASYHEHDLRKQAFFIPNNDRITIKPGYSGNDVIMFNGITTPEIILVRAECNTRRGEINDAVSDLNNLLSHRIAAGYLERIDSDISQSELLQLVLSERRKELVYRGRRWHDLKRFGQNPNLAKPLMRNLDGTEYNLPIGSQKWVLPIPPDVVRLGGLVQNER
ncbi:RagB/SusD family nutrient uptake outer membrane protein [Parapedobacter koreensis]|uniref:SusD family protein n=1 Tax=Parapedobacter koreensis TaxID=332977 RepID=A0A1H7P6L3_9SPHI|nr:RagB/SusD family nutrient uptake outer membrane protein [Parapedobacter koreensis]SEL31094.1 SusD family protein [Parapedobacter koreensis]